ncbi:MAG: hypothetical protein L6Q98_13130 [Anaerolineae bacterium]|nr:hypothetical protein [Anaerolineae bacterium]NUQ03266.1 hypothetical protein [Anaerolineae bacterium]
MQGKISGFPKALLEKGAFFTAPTQNGCTALNEDGIANAIELLKARWSYVPPRSVAISECIAGTAAQHTIREILTPFRRQPPFSADRIRDHMVERHCEPITEPGDQILTAVCAGDLSGKLHELQPIAMTAVISL